MAIGVVKFTFSQRGTLAYVFYVLNAIQIGISLIVVGLSAYIYFSVAPIIYTETAEIDFIFVVLGMYSTQIAIHYAIGFKITLKCKKESCKKSTRCLLLLWLLAGLILMINLIILATLSKRITEHLKKSIGHSLKIGMQSYLKNIHWKQMIDKVQYQLECCGIEDYKDWYDIIWLTKYQVNGNSDLAKKFASAEWGTYTLTPWSCCRLDFPMQCLHDPLQQIQSEKVWDDEPNVVVDTINTGGCLSVMQKPIESAVLVYCLIAALQVTLNVIIFVVARLLYTSCRNAFLLRDPIGVSVGWIFGRGDFGYSRGQTLYEIMADYKAKEASKNKTAESDASD